MFILPYFMYIYVILKHKEEPPMSSSKARIRHKHFRLDSSKISRAQKLLRAETETETIERALDFVLSEHRRNQLAWEANEGFLESGVEVQDVYGKVME
jgi:hypothetical protein